MAFRDVFDDLTSENERFCKRMAAALGEEVRLGGLVGVTIPERPVRQCGHTRTALLGHMRWVTLRFDNPVDGRGDGKAANQEMFISPEAFEIDGKTGNVHVAHGLVQLSVGGLYDCDLRGDEFFPHLEMHSGVNDEIKAFAADESMCVEFKGSAAEPKRIVPCLENGPDDEPRLTPAFREALQRFIDRWSATA